MRKETIVSFDVHIRWMTREGHGLEQSVKNEAEKCMKESQDCLGS
jgi:hypothetical protein